MTTETLLWELKRLPAGHPGSEQLRSQIVRSHAHIARSIALRYAHRGEPVEDLEQSAMVGLVKAINRYDPELGDRFMAYASPMMTGEVKRHFRDRTWGIRVPRRIQELRIALREASRDFSQEHGRSATVPEIATVLGISEEDAIEVLGASEAYQPISLDAPVADEDGSGSLGELLGADDPDLETVVDRQALRPLLDELPERERGILMLRFYGNQTQSQIAAQMGISQMHVSRLIRETLARLRAALVTEG